MFTLRPFTYYVTHLWEREGLFCVTWEGGEEWGKWEMTNDVYYL